MASLEELLAAEGFKKKRSMVRHSSSAELESMTMPLNQQRSSKTAERAKSDVSRYNFIVDSPTSVRRSRLRDGFVKNEKLEEGSSAKQIWETVNDRGSTVAYEKHILNEAEILSRNEIVEVKEEVNDNFKDIYSSKVNSCEKRRGKALDGDEKMEKTRNRLRQDDHINRRLGQSSYKILLGLSRLGSGGSNSTSELQASQDRSNLQSLNGESFEDNRRQGDIVRTASETPLDEAAIQAMVSILVDYIKHFLSDSDFRESLRENCFASLNFVDYEEGYKGGCKVIFNLSEAIETVERAVEQSASSKDVKKASLQLSVLKGLSSNDLKDGFTSGIPNVKLSACAHVYLSVIYKLQKKDRLSAKHLLQVFCISPFQARTMLLPELWENLFLPHLLHLKMWYTEEADSLRDNSVKSRKLRFLDKVYNEILDSGTYQFALYYMDWLTEGVEAPSVPSIHIPSVSVQVVPQESSNSYPDSSEWSSPVASFSPQPMVSRRLYEAVFSHSSKSSVGEVGDYEVEENIDYFIKSSCVSVSTFRDKKAVTESSIPLTDASQVTGEVMNSTDNSHDDAWPAEFEQEPRLHGVHVSGQSSLNSENGEPHTCQEASLIPQVSHASQHTKANELALKSLAMSAFEPQQPTYSIDGTMSVCAHCSELLNVGSTLEDLKVKNGLLNDESFLTSTWQDFICPLTGEMFKDPVTLETGQTFEREAICKWFDQGNKQCPVTGITLQHPVVPHTNIVVRGVMGSRNSVCCRHPLTCGSLTSGHLAEDGFKPMDEASVFTLEKLPTRLSAEKKNNNAKCFIPSGVFDFLLWRFEYGDMEEKIQVVELLLSCIDSEPALRCEVACKINKQCLLNMLHRKQGNARKNVVLLLTELVCLNRRKDAKVFLSSLKKEGMMDSMHILLLYLQSSPPDERIFVAILLLHFDLLLEPRKYSIYREEAVDCIITALDGSMTDEKIRTRCCRALLVLGGSISISGKITTDTWILRQAGYNFDSHAEPIGGEEGSVPENNIALDEEEQEREEWLKSLSASLLGSGRNSVLDTISKCLGSRNLELVRACLTTVAWLSRALLSLSNVDFQLSAFSALISRLKESLENSNLVEDKVLASVSLLNFSKIPECRVLLMSIADEIAAPLYDLVDTTWTAKELYDTISRVNN